MRAAIYSGRPSEILALNRLTTELAAKYGLPLVDLHDVFAADWNANHRRFEYEADHHWNEHAHGVAARAIADAMMKSHP